MLRVVVLLVMGATVLLGPTVHGRGPAATAEDGTPGALPGRDVVAVDETLKQAFISGDRALLAALYAPDAVLITPFGVFHGTEEIHGYIDRFFAANSGLHVTFGETAVVLNTAVHRAFVTSDPIQQVGAERIVLIHTVVIEQDHIVSLTAMLDPSDDETRRYAMAVGGTPIAGTPTP